MHPSLFKHTDSWNKPPKDWLKLVRSVVFKAWKPKFTLKVSVHKSQNKKYSLWSNTSCNTSKYCWVLILMLLKSNIWTQFWLRRKKHAVFHHCNTACFVIYTWTWKYMRITAVHSVCRHWFSSSVNLMKCRREKNYFPKWHDIQYGCTGSLTNCKLRKHMQTDTNATNPETSRRQY